jgi:hypothetical protein
VVSIPLCAHGAGGSQLCDEDVAALVAEAQDHKLIHIRLDAVSVTAGLNEALEMGRRNRPCFQFFRCSEETTACTSFIATDVQRPEGAPSGDDDGHADESAEVLSRERDVADAAMIGRRQRGPCIDLVFDIRVDELQLAVGAGPDPCALRHGSGLCATLRCGVGAAILAVDAARNWFAVIDAALQLEGAVILGRSLTVDCRKRQINNPALHSKDGNDADGTTCKQEHANYEAGETLEKIFESHRALLKESRPRSPFFSTRSRIRRPSGVGQPCNKRVFIYWMVNPHMGKPSSWRTK